MGKQETIKKKTKWCFHVYSGRYSKWKVTIKPIFLMLTFSFLLEDSLSLTLAIFTACTVLKVSFYILPAQCACKLSTLTLSLREINFFRRTLLFFLVNSPSFPSAEIHWISHWTFEFHWHSSRLYDFVSFYVISCLFKKIVKIKMANTRMDFKWHHLMPYKVKLTKTLFCREKSGLSSSWIYFVVW